MRKPGLAIIPAMLIVVQLACNLPQASGASTIVPVPQPEQATEPPVAAAPATETPTVTATLPPQDPLVLRSTLCWRGPGDLYVVVSGLKQGDRAKLLGKGSIPGWFILENPTYHDPCWVRASDVQIDPSVDLLSLKIYSPPPLKPTKTPKPTPTPP